MNTFINARPLLVTALFTSTLLLSSLLHAADLSGVNNKLLFLTDSENTIQEGATLTNNNDVSLIESSALNNYGTLLNNEILYIGGGSVLTNHFRLTNEGNFAVYGVLRNEGAAQLYNNNFLSITSSGEFQNLAYFYNDGSLVNNGLLNNRRFLLNSGSLTNNSTMINNVSRTINNSGDIVNNGTLTNHGRLTNSNSLVNNGSIINTGTLRNSGTLTNQANATITNTGDYENRATKTTNNAGTMNNEGLFDNRINSTLNNTGTINNSGSFNADAGSTINGTGSYIQTAGSTTIHGAMTQKTISINGGSLAGTGIINADVFMNGTGSDNVASLISDNATGTLAINGNYSQGEFGAMVIDFSTSGSDMLNISGTADLAGLLSFNFIGDELQAGTFSFLTFASLIGSFDNIYLPGFSGFDFEVIFGDTFANLVVTQAISEVPVPAAIFLFAPALLGLMGLRRKARLAC
jgi:hypothetical protein